MEFVRELLDHLHAVGGLPEEALDLVTGRDPQLGRDHTGFGGPVQSCQMIREPLLDVAAIGKTARIHDVADDRNGREQFACLPN